MTNGVRGALAGLFGLACLAAGCAPTVPPPLGQGAALAGRSGSDVPTIDGRAIRRGEARAEHFPPAAPGRYRFAGTCSLLAIRGSDLTSACADIVEFEIDEAGIITATFGLDPAAGRGGRLSIDGRNVAALDRDTRIFWVEHVRLDGRPVARGAPSPYLGGCSYTRPAGGRFALICMAVDEAGTSIEARFDAARPAA